jgi:DNA-binding CsgD family transcriptional regulator
MDAIEQNKNTVTEFIDALFTKGDLGVVIAPTPAAHISPLLLNAYGLTTAQSRVVALVIKGHSTRQIVGELHISANTVQEHLTAAFDKFGVRSRRELVAAVVTGHH